MALITRREKRGEGKFEGKLPLKCFSCNKIGHFVSRCPTRVLKYKPKFHSPNYSKDEECYYASEGVSNDDEIDYDEIGFIAIKYDEPIHEEKSLVSHVEKKS